MAQIFHRSTNTISKVSLVTAVLGAGALIAFAVSMDRGSYITDVKVVKEQPVPFSHKHHVTDDGIDCRYCHTSVETSSFAGVPSTKTCMSCHTMIWPDAPMLEPVRKSFQTNQAIQWTRVNYMPQFVYFDHSIHLHKGKPIERWGRKVTGLRGKRPKTAGLLGVLPHMCAGPAVPNCRAFPLPE